ncbi:MAG: hypothetical protein IMW98_00355 [Firmicutes bacterium]|nr:hypothetical protein [Bacillota bacterium]
MSHISVYRTDIVFRLVAEGGALEEDPAWPVLEAAVRAVAEARQGRVDRTVRDLFGRATPCDLAVHLPGLRGGVGVVVDRKTGSLHMLYDDYGRTEEVQAVREEILQNFAAVAVTRALQALHYQVDVEESGSGRDRRVLVRGVLA